MFQSDHLETVFKKAKNTSAGAVYGIPSGGASGGGAGTEFTVFQVVSLHPDRRSYLQRAFALSRDDSQLNRFLPLDPPPQEISFSLHCFHQTNVFICFGVTIRSGLV